MDATCNVQDSIHVFHLVHNMCPGFWVHIIFLGGFYFSYNSAIWFKFTSAIVSLPNIEMTIFTLLLSISVILPV